MTVNKQRRKVVKSVAAAAAATTLPLPFISKSGFASDPIVLGMPIAQSTAGGVADHLDHARFVIAGDLVGRGIHGPVNDVRAGAELRVVVGHVVKPHPCLTTSTAYEAAIESITVTHSSASKLVGL
jgi:hypothetical protein